MKDLTMEQERKRKSGRKAYIIIFAVIAILILFFVLHVNAITRDNPRMGMLDALSAAPMEMLTNPFHLAWTGKTGLVLLGIYGAIGFFMLYERSNMQLKEHDNSDTAQGSAHWMTEAEFEEFNMKRNDPYGSRKCDGPRNVILSQDMRLGMEGYKSRRNLNTTVIGGSGAGKSRFFASPNILQYNSNFIITDPSGELLEDFGKGLEDNGYEITILNLTDVTKSSRYNPFRYIKSEKDIYVLVNTLIKNTTPKGQHASDPFWENAEKVLIEGLALYLWHTAPPEDQTFANLVRLINMASNKESDDEEAISKLDILFDDLKEYDPNNLAVQEYEKLKVARGKTMNSILISAGTRLEAFELSNIDYLTSDDNIHLETFGDSRKALFVLIPTGDTTFNFIVSMLYSQLFLVLYEYAETKAKFGWKCETPDGTTIRTFRADDEEGSTKAEKKADIYLKKAKDTVVKFNKKRKVYTVYSHDGKIRYGWRGTKEMARQYQTDLKRLTKERCRRACSNHVRFILDEFANIGQIPDFAQKLSTMRKYEISCTIIIQALSQLKVLYKDEWNILIGNCDTLIHLGTNDQETNEYFSKRLGKRTVHVENQSFQGNGNGSTSINTSSIDLMSPDRIGTMDDDECIVIVRGMQPFRGKKYEVTKHPNYEYAHTHAGQFEIPVGDPDAIRNINRGPLSSYVDLSGLTKNDGDSIEDGSGQQPERVPERQQDIPVPAGSSMKAMNGNAGGGRPHQDRQPQEAISQEADDEVMKQIESLVAFGIKPGDTKEDIQRKVETTFNVKEADRTLFFESEE